VGLKERVDEQDRLMKDQEERISAQQNLICKLMLQQVDLVRRAKEEGRKEGQQLVEEERRRGEERVRVLLEEERRNGAIQRKEELELEEPKAAVTSSLSSTPLEKPGDVKEVVVGASLASSSDDDHVVGLHPSKSSPPFTHDGGPPPIPVPQHHQRRQHGGCSRCGGSGGGDHDEIDLDDFSNKWGVWRSFVELQKQREKKPVVVPKVKRNEVVKPLFEAVGGTEKAIKGPCNLYRPLQLQGFEGEEVVDHGGATHEIFSLFFEQLHQVQVTVRIGGRGHTGIDVTLQLFETMGENGTIYLPTIVPDDRPDMWQAMRTTIEVQQGYFHVGRVFAKAIIEGCCIPPCWASDFLLSYLVDEEPHQQRVPIEHVINMMVEIDPTYMWIKKTWESGGIPFEGLMMSEVLENDHDGHHNDNGEEEGTIMVGEDNWEHTVRCFFMARVSQSIPSISD